jgi:PadR family transcriptional regulator PadR
MIEKVLLGGLIRLHVLHHASREPTYGQWLIDELGHHGYRLSPGTLYPILHALERAGFLKSRSERNAGHLRRIYVSTAAGDEALRLAKSKVWELFREFFEDELRFGAAAGRGPREAAPTVVPGAAVPSPRAAARRPTARRKPARPAAKTARQR